ncbi:DUF6036 family nucleotidyltransferase [Dyadobacter fanqingshengii]|uniref:DUF6036 domain-containing protein n=1 Tax=Dyadobacter fanqingshengii TaxID=2906443 RepID=A0A9X1TBJ5_9BACT|nr:DUF6036 family nucleotidyltransferase [Dyadobacter fanqingshengii]MCF0042921.1 hypothetical protein [Dyadobacter fanqingshengii]USJ35477.1 hypothetical protein NFI81_22655 [Dyadobacter fanqingshengii]
MDLENNEFVQFTKCAQEQKLEYIVIGGFALFLNGLNRATNDVDIWINPTKENGARLVSVFRCMDLDESALAKLELLDFTQPQVFGFEGQIDILTSIHRLFDFSQVFGRSRKFESPHGATIHFLHLNDLREVKILARRPQDIRDVIMIDDFLKLQNDADSKND